MPEPSCRRPKRFALTIGDPTGIGPEITAKVLAEIDARLPADRSLVVLGDCGGLAETAARLGIALPAASHRVEYGDIPAGEPGTVAYGALEAAVERIHRGEAQALVTGPISKENLWRAGVAFSGHTEILQALARQHSSQNYTSEMLFVYGAFRMLLLTRHVPLRQVSESLTVAGVTQSLQSLVAFLQGPGRCPVPKIALMGVNPHAAEIDGTEERSILLPAVAAVTAGQSVDITPPLPADALFRGFDPHQPRYDAYVATYHDQGLIPFKLVAGLEAVNVTIGLPFLRTSVSHGVAMDIVGQGVADPRSLWAALESADSLTDGL